MTRAQHIIRIMQETWHETAQDVYDKVRDTVSGVKFEPHHTERLIQRGSAAIAHADKVQHTLNMGKPTIDKIIQGYHTDNLIRQERTNQEFEKIKNSPLWNISK